jgi:hypothetical protein
LDDKRLIAALAWRLAEEYGKQNKASEPGEQVEPGPWTISLPLQVRVRPLESMLGPLAPQRAQMPARVEYQVSPADVFAEIAVTQPDGEVIELRASSSELLENEAFVNILSNFINAKMIERLGGAPQ